MNMVIIMIDFIVLKVVIVVIVEMMIRLRFMVFVGILIVLVKFVLKVEILSGCYRIYVNRIIFMRVIVMCKSFLGKLVKVIGLIRFVYLVVLS